MVGTITTVTLGLLMAVAATVPEAQQKVRVKRKALAVLRRKILLVPLFFVLIFAGSIWLIDQRLMKAEAFLFEIGPTVRGRLDDFTSDYNKGDPEVIASYYAEQYTGSELGFDKPETISTEGGITIQ